RPSEAQLSKPIELQSIPLPSAQQRASDISEAVARAGTNGWLMMPNEGDVMHGGAATDKIYQQITSATNTITTSELQTARRMFNNLPAAEQEPLQREVAQRHMQLLDGVARGSLPTPHLDAFQRSVEGAIKPFEQDRSNVARALLHSLPQDQVRAKNEEDFFAKHIKAL